MDGWKWDVELADEAGKGETGRYNLQMAYLVCMRSGKGVKVIACTRKRKQSEVGIEEGDEV